MYKKQKEVSYINKSDMKIGFHIQTNKIKDKSRNMK